MAIIPQQTLFVWSEIENLGDLERLRLVLEYMPDEQLMQILEKEKPFDVYGVEAKVLDSVFTSLTKDESGSAPRYN